jgi:hypothetical protein
MNIRPGIYNIDIIQGELFDVTLNLQNYYTKDIFPISGDVYMHIAEEQRHQPIIKLATDEGLQLVADNKVRIIISPAQSSKLTLPRYRYDILFALEEGARPRFLIRGQITVTNTITKPT